MHERRTTSNRNDRSSVRIFDPESPKPPPSPPTAADAWGDDQAAASMTIDELFERYKQPELRTRATADDYRRDLRRWAEFCIACPIPPNLPSRSKELRTSHPEVLIYRDPEVAAITTRALVGFQKWLVAEGHSPRVVNKAVGNVRAVISAAAKRGLLSHAPTIAKLSERTESRIYTLDHVEVARVYHACDTATWPTYRRRDPSRPGRWRLPYSPADGWRALIAMLATYGMRTEDAVPITSDAEPLRWRDVRDQLANPHPAGKLRNRWGWIVFRPKKTADQKPDPLVLPITPLVRHHLRILAGGTTPDPESPVLDWPGCAGTAKHHRHGFYPTFDAIFAAAGVGRTDVDGSAIQYRPKHLRKTCVTWLENHRPGSSGFVTGHAGDRSPTAAVTAVQRKHYFNAEALVLDALLTCPILGGWGGPVAPVA